MTTKKSTPKDDVNTILIYAIGIIFISFVILIIYIDRLQNRVKLLEQQWAEHTKSDIILQPDEPSQDTSEYYMQAKHEVFD